MKWRARRGELVPVCPNNHECEDGARVCDTCGAALEAATRTSVRWAQPRPTSLPEQADDTVWPLATGTDGGPSAAGRGDIPAAGPARARLPNIVRGPWRTVERRDGRGVVHGIVQDVQIRSEPWGQSASRQILTMRIERYDNGGNRLQPVSVEMRGWSLKGQVGEGESVEVRGRWRGGVLRASRATNLTTGGNISTRSRAHLIIYVVAIGAFVAYAAFLFLSEAGAGRP